MSNLNNGFLNHNYQGWFINQREDNGYVNVTQMCKAHGKFIADWTRLKATKDLIAAYSKRTGIPITLVLYTVQGNEIGNNQREQGTWMPRDLALFLGQWLSPEFALWCGDILLRGFDSGNLSLSHTDDKDLAVLSKFKEAGLIPQSMRLQTEYVFFSDGEYYTDSERMAKMFDRRHIDIKNSIEDTIASYKESSRMRKNFVKETWLDRRGVERYRWVLSYTGYFLVSSKFRTEESKEVNLDFLEEFQLNQEDFKKYVMSHMFLTENVKNKHQQVVYVLKNQTNELLKVGVTSNLEQRVAKLGKQNGSRHTVLYSSPISTNAKDVERIIHSYLNEFRQEDSEWFDCTLEQALKFIKEQVLTIDPYYLSDSDSKLLKEGV